MAPDDAFYIAAERRIEHFAITLSLAATMLAALAWSGRVAAAFAVGALLSWLNFRWLKQGVNSLVSLSIAQADQKPRVPKRVYLKLLGRYALLGVTAYVILSRFNWPAIALLSGFAPIIAGVLIELIWELSRGWPAVPPG